MQWFNNMKIRNKHFFIFGIILFTMVFIAVFAVVEIVSIGEKNNKLIMSYQKHQALVTDAIVDSYIIHLGAMSRGYMLEEGNYTNIISRNLSAVEQSAELFEKNMNEFRGIVETDPDLTETERQQRLAIVNGINDAFSRYMAVAEDLKTAVENHNKEETIRIFEKIIPYGNDLIDKLQDLHDIVQHTITKKTMETSKSITETVNIVIILTVVILLLTIPLMLLTIRSINRPISKLEKAVAEIASGNLSYPIRNNRKDELGSLSNSICNMVSKMGEMIALQERLKEENINTLKQFETIWSKVESSMVIIDIETRTVLDANPTACRMYGGEITEMVGETCYKFFGQHECPIIDLGQTIDRGERKFIKSDGTAIPILKSISKIQYNGRPAFLESFTDISYLKAVEEQKRRVEVAEQANHTKSEFIANISHEMRTPLNAVLGLSGLTLEMEDMNEEAVINLEKIYNSGSTLLNIVNDILDISKIEAGKLELILNEYDMPSLINDVISQNILRIGSKLINFTLDISADIPAVLYGDDLRIKQVLNNLLSNAFKYTKEGTVELGIRTERSEEDKNAVWVTAWVRDTGMGIRPEDINKLFSDYSQVDTKANRKIEGTGLGLAITKKMVELMGGTISVESEYGKGSVFTIKLKQKYISDKVIGETVVANLKDFRYSNAKRKQGLQIKRIKMPYARALVVDDNLTNLDVAKGLMKPYGMQIDCVTSGSDAIAAILGEKVKYNVIFMDHMMPGMDGLEATRRIRDIGTDYAKNIPIIALTANAVSGNAEKFLNSGFQDFLSKPIDIPRLDEALRHWVRDKEKESELMAREIAAEKEAAANAANPKAKKDKADSEEVSELYGELPEIAGLDVKKGLSLYAGDTDIYLSILRTYAQNTPMIIEKLKNVTAENLALYAIEVHGLKGSSASIGAEDIRERGQDLETRSKAGDLQGVLELNDAFLRDVTTIVESICKWFAKQDKKIKKPVLNTPDPVLLEKLCQSLIEYDIDSIDETMTELEKSDYETNTDLIPWLKNQLIKSSYHEAAEKISVILKSVYNS